MASNSYISKPLDASGGMRPRGWRKPVPKLIPDPPKRHNSLSRSSSFRHLMLPNTNEPQPPMPDNWKETIDKALSKSRVQRPRNPRPPHHAQMDVNTVKCGATTGSISSSTRQQSRGEEKALPMLPATHAIERQSDAGSTLTESTTSTTVELSTEFPPTTSVRSSSLFHGEQVTLPQTPPPAPEPEKRGAQAVDDRRFYDAQYRIVYPQGLNCSKLDVTRRHVAVFPSLPRNTVDRDNVSADLTAFEYPDDGHSVRHPYASSVMLDKVVQQAGPPFSDTHVPDADIGCMSCVGFIFRGFVRRRMGSTSRVKY
ncbi:hypothetical protein BDY19DRAFT_573736 [Irpex rosettiformis]|uniref:Uncharacterized protein n=1 Tax=Irpex rosettiformis TaxID=378272 RepID=A0ACB8UCI0_9APHY|nr:hypothetical protein BDY19DRAFT_573736 [Irpex rosettiformis]